MRSVHVAGIVGDDSEDAGGPQPAGSTRPVRQAPDQRPAALAQEFYATWGREPTLAELAGLFGEGRSPSSDVLRGVLVATRPLTYLDSERFRDSVAPLSEFIADGTVAEVSAVVVRKQARELLEACIRELPDRERHVIECRFSLDGKQPETLRQLGERLGVGSTRVGQLQARALARLRQMVLDRGLDFEDLLVA